MPLDGDIKTTIEATIVRDLQTPKVPKSRVPKLKRVWNCSSPDNFLYGQRVGYYTGLVEGFMIERHKRLLTSEEHEEIFALIELYKKSLCEYFGYYSSARGQKKK